MTRTLSNHNYIKLNVTGEKDSFKNRNTTDAQRSFYQSPKWRRVRKAHMKYQLRHDIKRAKDIQRNSQVNTTKHYVSWLHSGKPLCQECAKIGFTMPATVCDHKQRMRDGGAKYHFNNLQWLCDTHHNQKSGRESGEARKNR